MLSVLIAVVEFSFGVYGIFVEGTSVSLPPPWDRLTIKSKGGEGCWRWLGGMDHIARKPWFCSMRYLLTI